MSIREDTRATERAAFITGLRDAADFLEQNPVARAETGGDVCCLLHYAVTGDELLKIAELIGGPFEQETDNGFFKLIRRFGPVEYQLYTDIREVASMPSWVMQGPWRLDAEVMDRLERLEVTS
jgi:hypothetical protein